ncbi:hypothetical protein EVAR_38417_1 [Eumeta japonica]|uniref:Uncharacterized protein n=1 Tax=Eumeta variegata TaxID=151549 RepID=A0A4C1WY69_EUMVA|nr:hypothetical protein EVAR_38417_1 [Eumeta japonica]
MNDKNISYERTLANSLFRAACKISRQVYRRRSSSKCQTPRRGRAALADMPRRLQEIIKSRHCNSGQFLSVQLQDHFVNQVAIARGRPRSVFQSPRQRRDVGGEKNKSITVFVEFPATLDGRGARWSSSFC